MIGWDMWYNKDIFERNTPALRLTVRGLSEPVRRFTMSDSTTNSPLKRCSKCGVEKPAIPEFFFRQKLGKNGLRANCKACDKAYNAANREKRSNYFAIYREKHRARRREYSRIYSKTHPRERQLYRDRNRARVIGWKRAWDAANPLNVRKYNQNRAARKRELPHTFTNEEWQYAISYFNGCCAYCGNPPGLLAMMRFEQDHFIPQTDPRPDNPGYVANNIVPACRFCNTSKKNRDPHEWLIWKFGQRKAKKIEERIRAYFDSVKDNKRER